MAAQRRRAEEGVAAGALVHGVLVECDDLRRAVDLMTGTGWSGKTTPELDALMAPLKDARHITLEALAEALR